jgi:death-on-curing protein
MGREFNGMINMKGQKHKKIPFSLSVDDIIVMHTEIIEKYGGAKGILNKGEIEHIVSRISDDDDIFKNGTIILRGIVCGHPFVDGNKRAGVQALMTYMDGNGYQITASDQKFEQYVLHLAIYGGTLAEIKDWLKRNTEKI